MQKKRYGIAFETKSLGECIALHAKVNALSEVSKEKAHGSTVYTVYYSIQIVQKKLLITRLVKLFI